VASERDVARVEAGYNCDDLVLAVREGGNRRPTGSEVAERYEAVAQWAHANRLAEIEVDIGRVVEGERARKPQRSRARLLRSRAFTAWSVSTEWVGDARGHTRLVLPLLQRYAVPVESSLNGDAVRRWIWRWRGGPKVLKAREVSNVAGRHIGVRESSPSWFAEYTSEDCVRYRRGEEGVG